MSRRSRGHGSPPFIAWPRTLIVLAELIFCCSLASPLSANDEEQSRRRQIVWDFIPRDRRLRETLNAVQQLRPQTRSAEAIKLTQWILDQPFDAFLRGPQKELQSARNLAELRLRSFPAEWRQEYERTFGLEARQLYEDAVQRNDEQPAIELLRRFRLTSAADDAALWLAERWVDRGELDLALSVLLSHEAEENALATSSALSAVSTARLSAALPVAAAVGKDQLTSAIRNELEERPNIPAVSVQNLVPAARFPHPRGEYLLPIEDDLGQFYDRRQVPVLRPRWTASLFRSHRLKSLQPLFDTWQSQQLSLNLHPVSPQRSLVVRNQVVVRSDIGVDGLDLATGQLAWSFPCETSLATLVSENSASRPQGADMRYPLSPETLQNWFGGNSQLGQLSSDGVRVYFTDSVKIATARPGQRPDAFQQPKSMEPQSREDFNRLVALELPPSVPGNAGNSPRIAWEIGDPRQANSPRRFFFGPPVAQAGRLLSIVESNREIRLLVLQAESGKILWEQPLADVDKSVSQESDRAFAALMPILAGDLVLCPTGTGVLSAVDAVTGTLRWSYFDGDLPSDPASRGRGTVVSRGRPGFAPVTLVRNDRILHLPAHSSFLHILDRATGNLIGLVPRQRACSLVTTTETFAVLLESHGCRAVRLADGAEIWRRDLPSVSGTAVALGTELLIPLKQGRYALLDLATGRELFWLPPRSDLSLGNLTVCGEDILSQTPDAIAVYPQAGFVERIFKDSVPLRGDNERQLLTADWELSRGHTAQAEQILTAALESPLSKHQSVQARHVLRELLYARLDHATGPTGQIFDRLKPLAVVPEERGRLIARQARRAIQENNMIQFRQALDELSDLPVDITFPVSNDSLWQQSSAACCRQLLAEADHIFPEFADDYRSNLLKRISGTDASRSRRNLLEFARLVCSELPATATLRDQLAKNSKRKHAAEMLWLQNLHGLDERWAATAAANLAELWSESGWPRDAVQPLRELISRWRQLRLPSGLTGQETVDRWPEEFEAKQWMKHTLPPTGRISAVSIRQSPDLQLSELMPQEEVLGRPIHFRAGRNNDVRQRFEPMQALTAEFLWKTQGEHTLISVVERPTIQRVHQWQLPAPIGTPDQKSSACQAHYFPVGLVGEFRGYSLLDVSADAPSWTQRPAALEPQKSVAIVGPGGPGFVTFQVQNSLFVCDPVDGKVLWQRTGLEPHCGLYADHLTGIIGDEQCLVVFGANRTNYIVYDTLTGRELRGGQLESEPSQPRRTPFGRKLLRTVRERNQFSARIWDPLTNDYEVQEPPSERNNLFQPLSNTEVAWLTPKGEITVYDVSRSQRTVEVNLPEEELEKMNSVRFFKDGARLLVNLQRNTATAQPRDHNGPYDRSVLPTIPVRDDLYAFDVSSCQLLWRKSTPHRSIVRLDPPNLPFLVMLSSIRNGRDSTQESMLVEVLDFQTGEVLARRDQLPIDRLINVEYNGVDQTVMLQGLKSRIQIGWQTETTPAK